MTQEQLKVQAYSHQEEWKVHGQGEKQGMQQKYPHVIPDFYAKTKYSLYA
jgi:hypothetical protein